MVSRPTATRYLNSLVEIGLVDKITVGRTHYYMNMPLMNLFLSVSDSQIKEDVQPIESISDQIPVASQKG